MLQRHGPLSKMKTSFDEYVHYILPFEEGDLAIDDWMGERLKLTYTKKIRCFCGKEKTKVYRQNFCYNCFWEKPQAGAAIFKPEESKAHLGIEDRDLAWEKEHHVQPHYVYLSYTGALKVGVTRAVNMPYRWFDQGATGAIVIAETPHRHAAGLIEVALKEHMRDKTNWRAMLKDTPADGVDFLEEARKAVDLLPDDLKEYADLSREPMLIKYPVQQYPTKVKSLNLDKSPEFEGVLVGIKGQYLIFEDGTVFNVRNNEGKIVDLLI